MVWFSVLGALALGPLIVAFGVRKWGARTTVLAMVLVAFLLPQTQLDAPGDTRAVGLMLTLVLFLTSLLDKDREQRPRLSVTTFSALGFVGLSSVWSIGSPSSTLEQAVTLLALMCLASIPFEKKELGCAITAAFLALLLTAASTYVADPASWWEANRLRGPMVNANNLALASILFFPVLRQIHRLAHFPVSAAALFVVALSGSRAALIALGVQIIVSSWAYLRASGRIVSIALAGVAAASTLPSLRNDFYSQGAGSESVLRSNNSRTTVWADSWNRVQEHPWFGGGLGSLTSEFETGSSLFAVWIVSGAVGVALIAVALGSTLIKGAKLRWAGDWRMLVVIGGCINAAFEGWLIAAGTVYALTFWLMVEQVHRHGARLEATPDTHAGPDDQGRDQSPNARISAAQPAVRTRW